MYSFDPNKYSDHIGKGLCSPEKTHFWLNIPKCASNTVSYYLIKNQWKKSHVTENKYEKIYVCLRDPIERWKASTIELCYHHLIMHKNGFDDFEQWFKKRNFSNFDKNVDLHHVRQVDFLYFCDLPKCEFVYMDEHFDKKIKSIFDIQEVMVKKNTTKENDLKIKAEPYVASLMTDSFIKKLKDFYHLDYELINKTNNFENSF